MDFGDCAKQLTGGEGDGSNVGAICLARLTFGSLDSRAHTIAKRVEAGYILINGGSRHFWGLPFGGVKASGIGREESLDELISYTETKTTTVMLS